MWLALGLGELSANGGATMTMPLLPGSLAIDHGLEGCPATDQRGYLRVGRCDSGSFEFAAKRWAAGPGLRQATRCRGGPRRIPLTPVLSLRPALYSQPMLPFFSSARSEPL